jgi:hypothetical protein
MGGLTDDLNGDGAIAINLLPAPRDSS